MLFFWGVTEVLFSACKASEDWDHAWRAQVFEGILNKRDGERIMARELTPEEKKRRVVLKRVNMDGSELRPNFVRSGTMARVGGAAGLAGPRVSMLGMAGWQGLRGSVTLTKSRRACTSRTMARRWCGWENAFLQLRCTAENCPVRGRQSLRC